MKKFSTSALVFLLLFSVFATFAYSHPGRTDSNGGHYNHDTGEYHYHSGEYAGQNQSSNSSGGSSIEWDAIREAAQNNDEERKRREEIAEELISNNSNSADIWTERGSDDGLNQLCIDTLYKNAFDKGFSDALIETTKVSPLFKFIINNDNRDILYYDFYELSKSYSENRQKAFEKYYIANDEYFCSKRSYYFQGYDNSYKNGSFVNASIYYKTSDTASAAKEKGYSDGYNQFYDGNLYAYRKTYPIEAFFTTLPLSPLLFVLLALFSIVAIILFLKWCIKSRHPKTTFAKKYPTVIETTPPQDIAKIIKFFETLKNQFSSPELLTNKALLLPEEAQSLVRPVGEEIKEIFIRKYKGVPISSFIKLPHSIKHIDKNGHIFYDDSHSTYGDYSVYVSDSGKVLHKAKWCSNAWRELNYLNLPEKYKSFKKCQRCFDIVSSYKIEKNEWIEIYKKIVLRKIEYGIDEMNLSEEERLLFTFKEHQNVENQNSNSISKSKATRKPASNSDYFFNNYKNNIYRVGYDIPEGTYFFSPTEPEYFAFFVSISSPNHKITNVTREKQRFYLVDGERIGLVNCYFETEDF